MLRAARVLSTLVLLIVVAPGSGVSTAVRSAATSSARRTALRVGLNEAQAAQVGVEWNGRFSSSAIIGGVDTEWDGNNDGYQYDDMDSIKRKVDFASKQCLGGMMLWRVDNDRTPSKTELPKWDGSSTLAAEISTAYGCKWSPKTGWEKPKGTSGCACPVVAGYIATFNPAMRSDAETPLMEQKGFKEALTKYTRFYLAFIHTHSGPGLTNASPAAAQGQSCRFQYAPGDPANEATYADVKSLIALIKKVNPAAEIFLTSGLGAPSYTNHESGKSCHERDAKQFANTLYDTLVKLDVHGYDMDWENGINSEAMDGLFTAVRERFKGHKNKHKGRTFKTSAAVWPTPGQGGYSDAFSGLVDEINIMSYRVELSDLAGQWMNKQKQKLSNWAGRLTNKPKH